jgi:hypothetical protein
VTVRRLTLVVRQMYIYISILRGSTEIHKQPTYWTNPTTTELYYVPSTPIDITSPKDRHTIRLLDYDVITDDYMGGIQFSPYTENNDFPTKIVLSVGNVGFDIELDYDF